MSVQRGTLTYAAAPGEVNIVEVTRFTSPYADGYNVFEDVAHLRTGSGCRLRSPQQAVCLGQITALRANLGDRNDMLSLRGLNLRATVLGGAGADLIETGDAPSSVNTGPGVDTAVGGRGDDVLTGGAGGDLLEGGDGADSLDGQGGDDVAMGQLGSGDALLGGLGRDLLLGGSGSDTLEGASGADALFGGSGADRLEGGAGDDRLTDNDATPGVVNCGSGDDDVRVRGNDDLVGCGGAGKAPATAPTVWPPRATATAAQVPPASPKVIAYPRPTGHASYVSLQIVYKYYETLTVRVRFYARSNRYLGARTYRSTARNPITVKSPRPPTGAVKAIGRCCY